MGRVAGAVWSGHLPCPRERRPLSQLFTYSFTSRKSTSINISSLAHQIPGSLNSFFSLSFLLLMNLLLVKQNYSKTVSTITLKKKK